MQRRLRNAVPTIVALGMIVAAWELFIVVTGEPEYILPPLHRIVETGIEHATDRFLPNAWVTLVEMVVGFALGGDGRTRAGFGDLPLAAPASGRCCRSSSARRPFR